MSHLCLLTHVDCGSPKLPYADVGLSHMDLIFCSLQYETIGLLAIIHRLRMGARGVDKKADR